MMCQVKYLNNIVGRTTLPNRYASNRKPANTHGIVYIEILSFIYYANMLERWNFGTSRRFYIGLSYFVLAIIGCIGFFFEFKIFLVIVVAMLTVTQCDVMAKIQELFFGKQSDATANAVYTSLFLALAVILFIATVIAYLSTPDISLPGFFLGAAVISLRAFVLERLK